MQSAAIFPALGAGAQGSGFPQLPFQSSQAEALRIELNRRRLEIRGFELEAKNIREFSKIRGTLFWGPYNKDPTI